MHNVTIILLLIALARDIELSPGPNNIGNPGRNQSCLHISWMLEAYRVLNKLSEFNLHFAGDSEVDIICVSETWLNDSVPSSEIY